MKKFVVLVFLELVIRAFQISAQEICIAANGKALVFIAKPAKSSPPVDFAAQELKKYLEKMSAASFLISSDSNAIHNPVINLVSKATPGKESYSIISQPGIITLSGESDRALLYAVYDFLERLGCLWLAPDFSFYNGNNEFVPGGKDIYFPSDVKITEKPVFKHRKLDLAEGRSLDVESLGKMIDWMPKARLNTLMVPLNMNRSGRMVWDNYRMLVPELKKRGIVIEVGQHGYQNFLNAGMEQGSIFELHPDWFGKDDQCNPSQSDEIVFNTENKEAVAYLIRNIAQYLAEHPEIDILDLWPPDNARWNECPGQVLEAASLRNARLVELVRNAISKDFPGVVIQMIAFASTMDRVNINEDIMVDICPIDQNFERQIFDAASPQNKIYSEAILEWRERFHGDLGVYTYYRKYAWRSLPNILPCYMQHDLKWFASIPLQSISCYAEPGDWSTYELNHYVLGKLEWDPERDVDSLVTAFCRGRYRQQWEVAKEALMILGSTVRFYGSIRNTSLKQAPEIEEAGNKVHKQINLIRDAQTSATSEIADNLGRLIIMLQYASIDLDIQLARSSGATEMEIARKLNMLREFQLAHADQGLMIFNSNNDIEILRRHYSQ